MRLELYSLLCQRLPPNLMFKKGRHHPPHGASACWEPFWEAGSQPAPAVPTPMPPPPPKTTFQAIIFMAWTPLGRGRGVPFGDQDPHPLALINPSFHIGPGALLGPVLTGRQRVTLFTAELRCCWNRGAACRYPGLCLVTPRKWCHVPSDLTLGSR